MSLQEQTPGCIEVTNRDLDDEQQIMDSIINATPPPSSTAKIHRVPQMVRERDDYDKYYVPKVVSIGPYHFGNPKLELVEKLKPVFTMKLLSNNKKVLSNNKEILSKNKETLRSLYRKLGEPQMVQEFRSFYEKNSTTEFCDKVFTKMMLLDCCFILYYIQFIFGEKLDDCGGLTSHQIVFAHQDLFLLENQIPFKVLREVSKVIMKEVSINKIRPFIYDNILTSHRRKQNWLKTILCIPKDQRGQEGSRRDNMIDTDTSDDHHLLHLLHRHLTKTVETNVPMSHPSNENNYRCTFRNVNELVDVGIHFEASDTMSLAHIEFLKSKYWWFSANVKLPPITVDDSTKPMLLNLIAYEMCSHDALDAGVTSYICLLDSLIDHPEDVKALRKAGVLENSLGSDKEVAKLFNEIGTDLVPNNWAYLKAKNEIQRHYESRSNTLFSQLKHEYVKSPWAFFALLGALIALLFSGVQTYFTVWSPKTECDGLCKMLKMNHHL